LTGDRDHPLYPAIPRYGLGLELPLLLQRTEPRAWGEPELVRELHSSDSIAA
jgi:hypothetical protein